MQAALDRLSQKLSEKQGERAKLIAQLNDERRFSNRIGAICEIIVLDALARLDAVEIYPRWTESGRSPDGYSDKLLPSHKLIFDIKACPFQPAEPVNDIVQNTVYKRLADAGDQTRVSDAGFLRCAILVSAGADELRNPNRFNMKQTISAGKPLNGPYNIRQIAAHAVDEGVIDIVLIIYVRERTTGFNRSYFWDYILVTSTYIQNTEMVDHFVRCLPIPRSLPSSSRSASDKGFDTPNRKLSMPEQLSGWEWNRDRGVVKVIVSRNLLAQLISGDMSHEEFVKRTGEKAIGIVKRKIADGASIAEVRLVTGGLDVDDDRIELVFSHDPAIAPFR